MSDNGFASCLQRGEQLVEEDVGEPEGDCEEEQDPGALEAGTVQKKASPKLLLRTNLTKLGTLRSSKIRLKASILASDE